MEQGMTPSSRIGRNIAALTIISLGLAAISLGATPAPAAPLVLNGSAGKPAPQAKSSSPARWTQPGHHRLNHLGDRSPVTRLGAARPHQQLVASRRHRPIPAYLSPALAEPSARLTNVVDQQTTLVQGQPQVIYLQPQCASPLIIRIEPGDQGERRNRRGASSPQPLYGASHPCVPEVVTLRQRDLQPGPRILSVRN